MKNILYILTFIFVISVSYGCWQLGRVINYKLSYKDMVIETIREQVKAECLK